MERLGRIAVVGHVAGWMVEVIGDGIRAYRDDDFLGATTEPWTTVDGLGRHIGRATDLKIGWARLPDFEVIYVYDRADGCFGYALNVTAGDLSEWGYAPFGAVEGEGDAAA